MEEEDEVGRGDVRRDWSDWEEATDSLKTKDKIRWSSKLNTRFFLDFSKVLEVDK